jgi:hypothetical protein
MPSRKTEPPPPIWASYELVWPRPEGERRPFSNDLALSSERNQALKIIQRVEDLGWPEAEKLTIGKKKKKRTRRIVRKDDVIYLLKCTTSCWRFYFYVRQDTHHFIYVHGVCKKRDAEDPADFVSARQRYDARAAGGLRRITFPS